MAYEVHAVVAITDIPSLVGSFASTNGFDVDSSNINKPIITAPGDSNSAEENLSLQIQALITGTNNQDHTLWWAEANGGSNSLMDDCRAVIYSPKMNAVTDTLHPTTSLPTRVHIFGTAIGTTSPFIAVVVEYGFNLYRHLFMGKMQARGNYTGREVISASNGAISNAAFQANWYGPQRSHLFNAHQQNLTANDCGGVRIIHADNPTEWRKFTMVTINTTTPFDEYTGNEVAGGFQDGWNDGWVMRAKSPFAGANELVPINLYAAQPVVGDTAFIPIGRPPGVRMVNMQDLEPGSEIVVGNETWRVFPEAAKSSTLTIPVGPFSWPTFETSYFLGYAYLVEDAP